jgi:hypothetical protein
MEELNIDKYSVSELKKLFTKHTGINCLNDFTVQDIEDSKKRLFMKMHETHNKEQLKDFLDKASERIISDKFLGGIKETQGVVVKNTVRDNLNADYKNTITRLILIDSLYRPDLLKEPTDYICTLNEKIVNTVSLNIENIQIPLTFYNIESRKGNNRFSLTIVEPNLTSATTTVAIPDGNYTLDEILTYISTGTNITATKGPKTGLITISTALSSAHLIKIDFMPDGVKLNTSLGWYLGFRTITGNSVVSSDSDYTLKYEFTSTTPITSTGVAMAPKIKYFVVVVDDFNKTQTADTLVQPQIDPLVSTPTNYFGDRKLTKAQICTKEKQNQAINNLQNQSQRLDVHAPNQILGVFTLDSSKLSWGDIYFSDKCKYVREYHSPTNLERFHVKIYDDTGFLLNLNGNNWYMTLMTENVYKY